MDLIRRTSWGAAPSKRPLTLLTVKPRGVKVHYEGTFVTSNMDHSLCDDHVRALQASHLANLTEGYSDIAYSAVVCIHGSVFEGRGSQYRCAANGNQELNNAHFAVCGMLGDSGQTEPTVEMLHGIRDAIEWLRAEGPAGDEIKGHKDGYATSCPGGPLYAWVQGGAPRPGTPQPTKPTPPPTPSYPSFPGRYLKNYCQGDDVYIWQQQMWNRGWLGMMVDGKYGGKSDAICRQFQTEKGLVVDGVVGPKTWIAAWTAPRT